MRRGRDLVAEDVAVVPIGGAQAIGRFLRVYRHERSIARLAGLCDAGEERDFRLALERTGFGHDLRRADMERLGFYVCEADLEDELIRCLGAEVVQEILAAHGKLVSFRTYQKQPAHRARSTEEQLRGFLNNWKIQFAASLVDALDLDRVPRHSTVCSLMFELPAELLGACDAKNSLAAPHLLATGRILDRPQECIRCAAAPNGHAHLRAWH